MTRTNSAVGICNLALDALGEAPITSIESPSTDLEETMARWYDIMRLTVLREQVWNFAQKYRVLPRTGGGEGGFADAYALPNDFVRLNSIGEDPYFPITDYEMSIDDSSRRVIYASNGDTLPIRYNRDITKVGLMDPLFVTYFALRLALEVAYTVNKKASIIDKIVSRIAQAEPKTVSVDGQERVPRRIQNSKYLAARRWSYGLWGSDRYRESDFE